VSSYQAIIDRATFLSSSPERVFELLKARASVGHPFYGPTNDDEALEAASLNRREPLINLGLAKYCLCEVTARKLFSVAGDHDVILAIRLSVLSNEVVGRFLLRAVPLCLFEGRDQTARLTTWLAAAADEEIAALFSNPKIDQSFLRDFLECKEPWEAVSDERRRNALSALERNPRMKTPYSSNVMDGYAEYSYNSVFDAAWSLAGKVPVTPMWANALHALFEQLNPRSHSLKKPMETAERWRRDPAGANESEDEAQQCAKGWLPPFASVRKELAKLELGAYASKYGDLLASVDPAFRCAAYNRGRLSVEEIAAAYAKDGKLFFNEAFRNRHLYRDEITRKALHDVAWDIATNKDNSHLDAPNAFNYMKDEIAKEYPDWFREEDAEPADPEKVPATKGDLNELAEAIGNYNPYGLAFQQVMQSLKTLNTRLGWIWWFSLGALVASSLRHL
jgi:hypothetical protein